MGEAARRRAAGFDGRKLGEEVLAALNERAGGRAWELVKGTELATSFLILDAETTEVRAGEITNGEAEETPHRVVEQAIIRRGEPWVTAMIFDPCELYRVDLYDELGRDAVRVAQSAMGTEKIDEVRHVITTSSIPGDREAIQKALEAAHAAEGAGNG
jgi:hypothetical protein